MWQVNGRTHLHQAVPDQAHEQLLAAALPHQRGVLGAVHAGEVEHGHVAPPRRVGGELQFGQLAVGGEVGRLVGVAPQGVMVHVLPGQQLLSVAVVLGGGRYDPI